MFTKTEKNLVATIQIEYFSMFVFFLFCIQDNLENFEVIVICYAHIVASYFCSDIRSVFKNYTKLARHCLMSVLKNELMSADMNLCRFLAQILVN
jgi:hypothetical protein